MKAKYLATEYNSHPSKWDPEYPCEEWCPEDINTILQCDIALNMREKLKVHPNVSKD